jgi:hypothetical protein
VCGNTSEREVWCPMEQTTRTCCGAPPTLLTRFCSGRTRAVEQPTKFDLADEVIE